MPALYSHISCTIYMIMKLLMIEARVIDALMLLWLLDANMIRTNTKMHTSIYVIARKRYTSI
jgi:hypothetical protein